MVRDEIVKQLSLLMAGSKESLIKSAISHVIGNDDWTIADITGRGNIKILPDKTEVFAFDGIDLIHFMHLETEIDHATMGISMRATQKYRIFYEAENGGSK